MSLTSALNIASSGMRAAQTGLRTVSDNIANVNTPGFARKIVDQSPTVISGAGAGVQVDGVRRATDSYLQRAMLDGAAEVGRSGVVAEFLDRAQGLFGDPSEKSSFFNRLDPIFTAFSLASENPTSGLRLSEAVVQTKRFFDDAGQIGSELRELGRQTGVRMESIVSRANGLLDDINALNSEISRSVVTGRDASGAENVQSRLIDELSKLIEIKVGSGPRGGVSLAVADGSLLTGENRGRFELASENGGPPSVRLKFDFGRPVVLAEGLGGGELKGLIELRDKILPELGEQLGEFTTRAADALNRAHNAASTAPAPAKLVGRPINTPIANAVEGFKGRTAVVVTNPDGTVKRRVDIDFDARTFSVNGQPPTSWTPADFRQGLSDKLAPDGGVSFDGVLEIAASAGGGVSIVDDPAAPSHRAGRGFSHYFGMNDLVTSPEPVFYDTGLTAADPHGFVAGGEISFRFNDGSGARFADVKVAIPTGGTLGDLLGVLNGASGVGQRGSFKLENGALRFTSKVQPLVSLTVLEDRTAQANGGESLAALHGLGAQRALRAETFSVRSTIASDNKQLSMAQFQWNAGVGQVGLARGNGQGGFGLAQAFETNIAFDRAGGATATVASVANYAAQMGGGLGSRASIAEERQAGAEIVLQEAAARRSSVEGVNLDEELVQLTVYQQAFNASARLITAAKEMYDVLLSIA
ncbi:MAG: flagellar hook-associated protein FlgK [Proteobacteria bacterium]|nr:flagellar hook-associated protein FlgK [Pseudomonadota bacterium]